MIYAIMSAIHSAQKPDMWERWQVVAAGQRWAFCGEKLCQDLDFWFFWDKAKEKNIGRFSPDVVNKYLRFYPYFNETESLALELS